MSAEKLDVFVGNLSYTTSEVQLREIFSPVGTVVGVRIVTDRDTGRPKGYAFVEFLDTATALSAIRNIDGYDLNGRKVIYLNYCIPFSANDCSMKLTVSYSNNSAVLKESARSMGHSVHQSSQSGGKSTDAAIASMKLTEVYDVLEGIKALVDEDQGHRARALFEAYPQLIPAILAMQVTIR